jgi:hypothetical protein
MTPFDQDEALQQLLGRAREIEPRGNFLPNVMRAIRTEPQERGVWARLKAWWFEEARAWATPSLAAAAALALSWMALQENVQPVSQPAQVSFSSAVEPIQPLEDLDQMTVLLAMEDTSSLTDQEIGMLLY